MKKILRRFYKNETGNAIILVSFAMLGLLSMTGLVIDGGSLYMTKSHLQKVANAAALSGVQEVFNSNSNVTNIVNEIIQLHKEESSILTDLDIKPEGIVRLQLDKNMPLAFSTLFGVDTTNVGVIAAAEVGTMGAAVGAVPIGIDERFELELYKEYELKTDTVGADTGWFGILALGGPGAATYYDNLRYGYKHEIKYGDVIETQTGNVAGKTKTGINERINECPYTFDDAIKKKCPRIILIPVYETMVAEGNQIKEVKIKGFAYFYLSRPVTGNDTSVHGMFINFTGQGKINESALNRGAYSIRLTE